jgi:hypothetical protein
MKKIFKFLFFPYNIFFLQTTFQTTQLLFFSSILDLPLFDYEPDGSLFIYSFQFNVSK